MNNISVGFYHDGHSLNAFIVGNTLLLQDTRTGAGIALYSLFRLS